MRHDRGVHVVFVHGTGRSGPLAWPGQVAAVELRGRRLHFPDLAALADDDAAATVLAPLADGGGHLVAHSAGAVAALLAAGRASGQGSVRSLVLLEPAAFSLARGGPEVEEHVARLSAVFADAREPRVLDGVFAVRFLTGLGVPGAAIADPGDPALRALGRRVRRRRPPWEAPLDGTVVRQVPTLVVTGGWNALYDEVADALVALGATRRVLTGLGHRPQDHPDANALLLEHWAAAER